MMKVLLSISSSLILQGALFRLQHYPYGIQILWVGIVSSLALSYFEVARLRKIVNALESKNQE
ncbi:hypothetical protein ACUNWD_16665 [Sunxiuqinia sp. A32]|uniref:hypothetical protein n=1 Tax=Sunxiuqinia sp. A32 TaxID=3461496 RepID=UPI0040461BA4